MLDRWKEEQGGLWLEWDKRERTVGQLGRGTEGRHRLCGNGCGFYFE